MSSVAEAVASGVRQPKVSAEGLARCGLFAILAGMLALPLVPGWQGLARLLAAYVLLHALSDRSRSGPVRTLVVGMGLLLLLWAASWVQSALSDPGRHFLGTLTDVYGLALPLYGGLALVALDAVLVFGLTCVLWRQTDHRVVHVTLAMGVAFWLLSLSGPLAWIFGGGVGFSAIQQMLAGSSEWAVWVLFLCLCFVLARDTIHVRQFLLAVLIGGVMMAVVIAMQFAFSDFAYVLDAARLEDYFYRARGTAYYHAPATYTVAVALMIAIGFVHGAGLAGATRLGFAGLAMALAVVVSLNDTRGLNLALVGGLGLFAAIMLLRRDWRSLILTLVLIGIIVPNMIYTKPMIGGVVADLDPGMALLERLAPGSSGAAAGEVSLVLPAKAPAIEGSLRLVLMQSGIRSIGDHLLFGTGIGNLNLVISEGEGYTFSSTNSSHTLYIDIALMAGLPALVMFLGLCGLAFLIGIGSALRDRREERSDLRPGVIAAFVVLGIGAVFLPQEMNNLVALFFVFPALLLVASLRLAPDAAVLDRLRPPALSITWAGGAFTAALGIAVLGWAVLTSPTHTLPLLNLVARHADEIDHTRAEVYVSTPLAAPIARVLLRLWGVQDPTVRLLSDNPAALPRDNAFIIWHPATDWRYPVLKAELPYRVIRPGSTAPSVEFPHTWWMLDSIPYARFLMLAGPRSASDVLLGSAEAGQMPPDLRILPDVGRFIGIVKRVPARSRWGAGESLQTAGDEGQSPTAGTGTFDLVRNLTDANPNTGQSWKAAREQVFYFDLSPVPPNPIGAYRLIPYSITTANRERRMQWQLFGSEDLRTWDLLDDRTTILGSDPEDPASFAIPQPRKYRYLMLVFEGVPGSSGDNLLGDIELFPTQLSLAN